MTTKDKIARLQIRIDHFSTTKSICFLNNNTGVFIGEDGNTDIHKVDLTIIEDARKVAISAYQKEIERLEHLQFDEG